LIVQRNSDESGHDFGDVLVGAEPHFSSALVQPNDDRANERRRARSPQS
jgi:hypothetical protein